MSKPSKNANFKSKDALILKVNKIRVFFSNLNKLKQLRNIRKKIKSIMKNQRQVNRIKKNNKNFCFIRIVSQVY